MLRLTQEQRDLLTQHVENALITHAKKRTILFGVTIPVSADQYIHNKTQCAENAITLIANAFRLEKINTLKNTPINVSEARQSLLSRDDKKAVEVNENEDNIKRNITELIELITSLDKNTNEKLEDLVHCMPGKMNTGDRAAFINHQKTRLKDIKNQLEGMQKIFEEQLNPTPPSTISSNL